MQRKRAISAAAAILLLLPSGWVAWQSRHMAQMGHLGDDGVYWAAAKALAHGRGYIVPSLPEQPAETKYPPAFPALLSLAWITSPANVLSAAAMLSWLMLPLMLAGAAFYYRRSGLGPGRIWLLCALIATNLLVVRFTIYTMPDLLFCGLLLTAIAVADSAHSPRQAAIAGLIAGAAYLTKAAALPLLICSPMLFLWRNQRRHAVAFAVAMGPFVVLWNLWASSHRVPGDEVTVFYTDYLGYQLHNVGWRELPIVLRTNLRDLPGAMGAMLAFPPSGTLFGRVLPVLATALAIAGIARDIRRNGIRHYHAFAAGFVPQLAIWHFPPNPRFVLPLYPLFLAALWLQVETLAGWIGRNGKASAARMLAAAAVSAVLLNVALGAILTTYGAPLRVLVGESKRRLAEAEAMRDTYRWIVRTFPPETAFVADLDQVFHLETGLPAVPLIIPPAFLYQNPSAMDDRRRALADFARNRGIGYVLATPWDYMLDFTPDHTRGVMADVLRNRSVFEPIHQSHGATVYRIASGGKI
jgi:hypothetical protein